MMAAVRCAARRLGGSLLQRTQAAVAEEGRRLVPSRFMRSGQLSSEHARRAHFTRQIQQKKEELYNAVSKAEQKKQELFDLFDLLCQEEKACLANEQHLSAQATKGPVDPLPGKVYSKRARGVLDLTCKVTFLVYASAFLLGITGTGKMLGLTREARAHSARQTQQKEQELYDLLYKANEKHLSGQATEKRPFDPRRWNVYSERARAVLDVACKVTFFVYSGAFLLGITGAGKMLGITKEVSEDKIKK